MAIVLVVVALFAAIIGILYIYTIDEVRVDGNIHYTDEEIEEMIINNVLCTNSIYLSFRYQNEKTTDIPFMEIIDVERTSPNTVRITCYEKSVAGYVEYLGNYMYFDKDGMVVETSSETTKSIPLVAGLQFDYIVLYEPLPIENVAVFQTILELTQLFEKYELDISKIYFDTSYSITLYFDEVRVRIGGTDDLDAKILKLKYILPELEGEKGILYMEDYVDGDSTITFELDKE